MVPIIAGAAVGGYIVLRGVEAGIRHALAFRASKAASSAPAEAPKVRGPRNVRRSAAPDADGASSVSEGPVAESAAPAKPLNRAQRRAAQQAAQKTLAEQLAGLKIDTSPLESA